VAHRKYQLLVEKYADIDKVLYWDGRINGLLGFVRQLKENKVELAVILHSRVHYDVLSAVLGGCKFIVRDDHNLNGDILLGRWLAAASESDHKGHIIQRKLNLLSVLGCKTDEIEMIPPCPVDPTRFHSPDKTRIGFQLGASKPEKCWPISSFVALAEMLLVDRADTQIVLLGTAQEKNLEEQFFTLLKPSLHGRIESLLGRTSVVDAFDAVAGLDLLVTGDTGPLHLAIASRVKTVSLYLATWPVETGPYQDPEMHVVVVRPGVDKMAPSPQGRFTEAEIDSEKVFHLVKQLLATN
jgi:ADP-heptose:LPS heptosyltransferase